jgi:hypothetical protein
MMTRTFSVFAFCLSLAASASPACRDSQPFVTIDQGSASGYGYGDDTFVDGDWFVISDAATWEWFWAEHTSNQDPPPELPAVDFSAEDVLVDLQGYRTSSGYSTEIIDIDVTGTDVTMTVVHDETGGFLTVITNPYHIVRTAKLPAGATITRNLIVVIP